MFFFSFAWTAQDFEIYTKYESKLVFIKSILKTTFQSLLYYSACLFEIRLVLRILTHVSFVGSNRTHMYAKIENSRVDSSTKFCRGQDGLVYFVDPPQNPELNEQLWNLIARCMYTRGSVN